MARRQQNLPATEERGSAEDFSEISFSDIETDTVSEARADADTLQPTLAPSGKPKKERGTLAERVSKMNRAEKGVYYGKRIKILNAEIAALQEAVGPDAIELANSL